MLQMRTKRAREAWLATELPKYMNLYSSYLRRNGGTSTPNTVTMFIVVGALLTKNNFNICKSRYFYIPPVGSINIKYICPCR